MSGEDALGSLGSRVASGLEPSEVRRRQAEFGPNAMTARAGVPAWKRFLLQFHQLLVYVLLVASLKAALLGEYVDAAVIAGVVVINAVVGYIQEAGAERAIQALSRMLRTEATVRREGRRQRVPAADLVPGDVVLLQSGDQVPADLRLITVRNLQCEEAALTGESVPAEKSVGALAESTGLADRNNLAFAGTLVTYGQAEGVVVATGDRTETGRIASLIAASEDLMTPLTRKIHRFSQILVYVILALAVLTFLLGWMRGNPAADMFMAAIALAVGAIPEGLPAAVTITLAIGVNRMAARRAIIRRLPAVETLGSTTVICSDKTGTLTENQMTVREVHAGRRWFQFTGSGYASEGQVQEGGREVQVAAIPSLAETLRAGLLCNDTLLVLDPSGRPKVQGDPTEAALLVAAQKGGLPHASEVAAAPRLDVIPFESQHMYMATMHEGRPRIVYLKGALDRLLERCGSALDSGGFEVPLDAPSIRTAADRMASEGLRVLAFARRQLPEDHPGLRPEDIAGGLVFLGLQGMMDPPRAEAAAAVRHCQQAGIAVKMITGDHAVTASAIAAQLGLQGAAEPDGRLRAVSGEALARIPDEALPRIADETAVFARVAPEQKLRLVRALQAGGHVVAMTGDGVNDAPALKQADIGVAMGIAGTDVAKGAAAMVLLDDNFASIEAAVEEGRNVFDNLVKFIVWTLPTNGGEGLLLLAAILLGTELPILPIHLLWINMTTAVLLGLMLVFEPREPGLMQRPPRDPRRPLLTLPLILRTALVSILMLGAGYGLFAWEQRVQGATIAEARTIVVNLIVVVEAFYLFTCRSLTSSVLHTGWFTNRWIWIGIAAMTAVQLLFNYLPLMNRWFHTAPVRIETWGHVALAGFVVFLIVEFEKWIRFGGGRGDRAVPE
ncbi:MAG: cation-transporting P-type ATPase [Verrucomicrobia bacterium]|nr:cation-transporting P-type ATPase [Verrucomicrobiota bacterium]